MWWKLKNGDLSLCNLIADRNVLITVVAGSFQHQNSMPYMDHLFFRILRGFCPYSKKRGNSNWGQQIGRRHQRSENINIAAGNGEEENTSFKGKDAPIGGYSLLWLKIIHWMIKY